MINGPPTREPIAQSEIRTISSNMGTPVAISHCLAIGNEVKNVRFLARTNNSTIVHGHSKTASKPHMVRTAVLPCGTLPGAEFSQAAFPS